MSAPKVLGVECELNAHGYHGRFAALYYQIEYDGAGTWHPYVADMVLGEEPSLEKAIAAIERELLEIRKAIPEKP